MSGQRIDGERRSRVRRVTAFAGILAAVGVTVSLRAATVPPPYSALAGTGQRPAVHGTGSAPRSRAPSQAGSSSRQVLTGSAVDIGYGTVQVQVTLLGGRITDVTPLSLPQGGRSSDISAYAEPQLRTEALAAQSAQIDVVSGASYTSSGYASSLQSALDKAN